ncbi:MULTISPECIES: hypothetical protein [Streptomyces]|uniref:Uncharacterized protein n=1 Tax=Streptomyces antimycoticus TaxID=68175 RepID=A0ABD5JSD4_9ACTN|nr:MULTISPECIES: hypothetical protein [Streptomyces]MEE4589994.1 hypothetical protein [Streptomyces sp. DSM 41602]
MDQDDDGLLPGPTPGEADLIGRPAAQALPRAQPPEQRAEGGWLSRFRPGAG